MRRKGLSHLLTFWYLSERVFCSLNSQAFPHTSFITGSATLFLQRSSSSTAFRSQKTYGFACGHLPELLFSSISYRICFLKTGWKKPCNSITMKVNKPDLDWVVHHGECQHQYKLGEGGCCPLAVAGVELPGQQSPDRKWQTQCRPVVWENISSFNEPDRRVWPSNRPQAKPSLLWHLASAY